MKTATTSSPGAANSQGLVGRWRLTREAGRSPEVFEGRVTAVFAEVSAAVFTVGGDSS